MSKALKNTTGSPITVADVSETIPAMSTVVIPVADYKKWSLSSDFLTYVNDATTPSLVVNDGSQDLRPSRGVDLIKGFFRRGLF